MVVSTKTLTVFSIVVLGIVRHSLTCPSSCDCGSRNGLKEVICYSKGLISVPSGIPPDTNKLWVIHFLTFCQFFMLVLLLFVLCKDSKKKSIWAHWFRLARESVVWIKRFDQRKIYINICNFVISTLACHFHVTMRKYSKRFPEYTCCTIANVVWLQS